MQNYCKRRRVLAPTKDKVEQNKTTSILTTNKFSSPFNKGGVRGLYNFNRELSGEISNTADIQFFGYHYKTGDIQLFKYSKCIEAMKNPLPCLLTVMV